MERDHWRRKSDGHIMAPPPAIFENHDNDTEDTLSMDSESQSAASAKSNGRKTKAEKAAVKAALKQQKATLKEAKKAQKLAEKQAKKEKKAK